jgi:hypothetical protein
VTKRSPVKKAIMKGADAPLAGVLDRRPLPPLVEADDELPRMVRRDQRSGQPHDPH